MAASVGVEPRSKMARTDTGLSLKIKVSSILDQSSDREVVRWSREELNFLRSRYRSLEGEDPMKSEEVTDDQLSVLCELTKVGIAPLADFGVWKPFGQRHAETLKFTSHFLDHTGAWRAKKSKDPIALQHGKHVGAYSGQQPSCATLRLLRFWIGTHRGSKNVWTGSRTRGTYASWLTRDVGQSCGNLSTVANLNATKAIQRSQHLFPAAHGTVLFVPHRTTAISGKRSWKTRWRISETCVKS